MAWKPTLANWTLSPACPAHSSSDISFATCGWACKRPGGVSGRLGMHGFLDWGSCQFPGGGLISSRLAGLLVGLPTGSPAFSSTRGSRVSLVGLFSCSARDLANWRSLILMRFSGRGGGGGGTDWCCGGSMAALAVHRRLSVLTSLAVADWPALAEVGGSSKRLDHLQNLAVCSWQHHECQSLSCLPFPPFPPFPPFLLA